MIPLQRQEGVLRDASFESGALSPQRVATDEEKSEFLDVREWECR